LGFNPEKVDWIGFGKGELGYVEGWRVGEKGCEGDWHFGVKNG